MATVTVSTKDELESAVKNNAEKIIITGDLAKEIAKVQKKKSVAKKVGIGSAIGAGVAVAAGIAAGTINSIAKNYNVKVSAGSTTVECTRK